MPATSTLMTAEELLKLRDNDWRHELIRGTLRRLPFRDALRGCISSRLATRVAEHTQETHIGVVFSSGTGFKIASDPDTVRAPDMAFVRRERIPESGLPRGYFPGAPDLAVEVVSPGDTVEEVEEKIEEWLNAGTVLVWIVNPRRRTVSVHRTGRDVRVLRENDTLDGEDLLPGFTLRVGEIFL